MSAAPDYGDLAKELREWAREMGMETLAKAASAIEALVAELAAIPPAWRKCIETYDGDIEEYCAAHGYLTQAAALRVCDERDRAEARVAELERQAKTLHGLPASDKKELADFAAFLGMPEANMQTMADLRARVAALEAENTELRAAMSTKVADHPTVPPHNLLLSATDWQRIVVERDAALGRLMDKLAAAREDAARMDWLDGEAGRAWSDWFLGSITRQSIDAARLREKEAK